MYLSAPIKKYYTPGIHISEGLANVISYRLFLHTLAIHTLANMKR